MPRFPHVLEACARAVVLPLILAAVLSFVTPVLLALIPLPASGWSRVWSHETRPRWVVSAYSSPFATRIMSSRAWPGDLQTPFLEGTHPITVFPTNRPTSVARKRPAWSRISTLPAWDTEDLTTFLVWKDAFYSEPDQQRQTPDSEMVDVIEDARGWPASSLMCRFVYDYQVDEWGSAHPKGGISLTGRATHRRHQFAEPAAIPLIVIPSGMVINILFFAAVIVGPRLAISGTIRCVRARNGRCPQCGYPVKYTESTNCSECGYRLRRPADRVR